MALMELASDPTFDCTGLVACVDRSIEPGESKRLLRDLGWVGFNLITLEQWAGAQDITSKKWIFLGMEM